jgi:cation:H+ antiporter
MVTLLAFGLGLYILLKSADVFVAQSSSLAKKLKVSDFIIGFTVVAFGTSLPEFVSTIFASLDGHNQLVVSNIIGSNIVNICLIFGLVAIFNIYKISSSDVNINIPINLSAMMVFWAIAAWSRFTISWPFGLLLILVFLVLIRLSKDHNHFSPSTKTIYEPFSPWLLVISLITLIMSGKFCIEEVIGLSVELNISETILGYFLLALGTSLPELVTTWTAVKKNDGELGVGNILGSNLFNLLFILGISSFIHPVSLAHFTIDFVFLTIATLAIYLFATLGKKYYFTRREGLGLVLIYLMFIVYQLFRPVK